MLYDVEKLIKIYVEPLLDEECKRLGVPREFIKGVYGCYYEDWIAGRVEEIHKNNRLVGVRIRIADCNNSRDVLQVFFHEMYHVKEMIKNQNSFFSELRADLYAEKRILQLALNGWKYLHK